MQRITMLDVSSEKQKAVFVKIKLRLLSKSRTKAITIEKSMSIPPTFEKFIEYEGKKYSFKNHYVNYYSKHHDAVYHEV